MTSARKTPAAEEPAYRLGLAIYTQMIRRRALKAENPKLDLFVPETFLEHCHKLGAGGMQVPLGVLTADACRRLRDRSAAYGMFIEGIADPPFADKDIQRFEAEIRTAAEVGARAVRTVIIPGRRYERFQSLAEFREFVERGRKALRRAVPIVTRHRVRLAVENHKDQRTDQRLALLREIDCPFVGACVDTGNSFALLEDPLAVVEALAPYAFSVHIKDQAVRPSPDGFLFADVALGDGFLPLKKMVDLLRRAQPDVQFSLESITRDPLVVPCLAESYWPTFPDVPARDLARTLAAVRAHKSPTLQQISPLPLQQQVEAETAMVERSLRYAHRELGL